MDGNCKIVDWVGGLIRLVVCISCGVSVPVGFCGFETRTSFECCWGPNSFNVKVCYGFFVNVRLYVWQFDGCNVLLFVLFDDSLIVMEGFCVPASMICVMVPCMAEECVVG